MDEPRLPMGQTRRWMHWRHGEETRYASVAAAPTSATARERSRIATRPGTKAGTRPGTRIGMETREETTKAKAKTTTTGLRHLFCGLRVDADDSVDADALDIMGIPARRVSLLLLLLLSVSLLSLSLSLLSPLSENMPPRVRLPQGTYEGRVVTLGQGIGGVRPLPRPLDAFLGIPYAQTTGDAHRFRAPLPLPRRDRDDVGDATHFGPRCAGSGGRGDIPESEDCLNANIYVPRDAQRDSSTRLPVVVYVHGGGFNSGCGAERDMASFVSYAADDILGVSFNYRVGALGFLGWWDERGDGDGDGDGDAPLNLGLLDQQALFAWVQANIAFFGGDPDNVTIMGLSAGAHSIGHHLQHYAPGKAPFHRAILESGAPTARAVFAPDHPRPHAQLRDFLRRAGVPASATGPDVVAALRRLPLATILRASRGVWAASQASVCWPFQPVVDGAVVPPSETPYIARPPIDAWRRHNHARVPVLTGFNTHEGTLFVPRDAAHADTDAHFRAFFATLIPGLRPADLDLLESLYPAAAVALPPGVTGRQWPRLQAAYAHFAYICPVLQTGAFLGLEAAADPEAPPVYLYEFAAHATALHTANHGDNAPVVAHDMAVLAGHPGLLAVADAMHGAWVRFAVTGNPNSSEPSQSPVWHPFHEKQQIMVFGAGNDERVPPAQRQHPTPQPGTPAAMRSPSAEEHERCRFWWDRVDLSEGYGRRVDGFVGRL